MYDDKSAIQTSIDLDFYDTGFGFDILASRANSGGFEDWEWWIYTLDYSNSVYEGEYYATDYKAGWRYYNFPDSSNSDTDMQEFFVELSWPEICPVDIVPSYAIIWMWPAKSNNTMNTVTLPALGRGDVTGWLHCFGLSYDWTAPAILPETTEQVFHLSTEFVYNDGVMGVDHDWSHMVLGFSTDFDLVENLTFTTGVYHQIGFDKSVSTPASSFDKDETWVSLSMKYMF